jgi:ArsR family transcriptional regulator
MSGATGMSEKVRLFFEGLSDAHRIKMVEILLEREMNVSGICKNFSMKQPSVSHHLAVLKNGGILNTRKSGKETYYSVNKKYVSSIMTYYFARFGFMVKEVGEESEV